MTGRYVMRDGVHAAYRTACRAIALALKSYGYLRARGVVPAARRVAQGISSRLLTALSRRSRADDGSAPLVICSAGVGLEELPRLPPGTLLSQEISAPVECVYRLELLFPASGPGPRGHIVLSGRDGSRLHREPLRPRRRDRHGRYLVRLEHEVSVPAAAGGLRVDVELGDGRHPGPGPLLNPAASIGALRLVRRQPRKTELLNGALALRILARASRTAMCYHRTPVPADLTWGAGVGRTLYVIGGGLPELEASEGATMAVRRLDVRACLASRFVPGRDLLLLTEIPVLEELRELVKCAQSAYVPILNAVVRPAGKARDGKTLADWRQGLAWSDALLVRAEDAATGSEARLPILRIDAPAAVVATVDGWLPEYRRRIMPRVSVVSALTGKPVQLAAVLESYFRQTYPGELEIVFVGGGGEDDALRQIEQLFDQARASGAYARLPSLTIVRNDANAGACVARNRGVMQAGGDLIAAVEADCLLCREFVARHAEAHSYRDCDIVIGPQIVEAKDREPLACLDELERHLHLVAAQARPDDPLNPHSFLNCAAGSFSVRRDFVDGDLYDPQFDGDAEGGTACAWGDVEMGYRLFQRGGRIKYVGDAFGVRFGRPDPAPAAETAIGALRGLRRLLERHPDIALEARRWVASTFHGIREHFDRQGHPENDDTRYVERILGAHAARTAAPAAKPARRPLRILSYRWHVPHQYELYKLPHEFTLLSDLDSPMTNRWEYGHRPLPDNVCFRSCRGLRFSDYDLAILHFDENVLSYENTHGVLGPDWGAAFRWFVKNVELPKVAICHGTPQFRGQYDIGYDGPDLMRTIEPAREKLVEYVGDMLVVCNSYQAQREWRFRRSKVIWHGFDPTEFPPATYERGILSPFGPQVISRPHYRGYFLYRRVLDGFPDEFASSTLHVPDPSPLYEGNHYAIWKYRNYLDEIRRYSVYFNPTLRSPMPRARGEPMMCGVVTVSANNHDVDMFIRNGVNGFYSDDADELRENLLYLCRNPDAARRMGAEARRTAADVFNHDRYLGEWQGILSSLT